jgi:hypothetical protein
MSGHDQIVVLLAMVAGACSVIYRRPLAEWAVRWDEVCTGHRWNLRSLEASYVVAGVFFVVWAMLVVVSHALET